MKCPHCGVVEDHIVKETRKFDEGIYRRRKCGACNEFFVSLEQAPHGLMLPRIRKKNDPFEAPGAHLHKVWG